MVASEARILANRQNCLKSTGPSSEAGKLRSRRNGLTHGLTASVVFPEGDGDEIDRRTSALAGDLDPQSPFGAILIRQIASLSVKMERGAKQESEALAARVRHAADAFDEARIEEAKRLFAGLADDPRETVRKLRKSPEGVDLLVMTWRDLRSALTGRYYSGWVEAEFDLAAKLLGVLINPMSSPLGKLSRACTGNTTGLDAEPGSELEPAARKAWARERLHEIIDAEIAGLMAHRATLDFETIALDRAGAADIALFDASPEATLARRYESEARRGFFKAMEKYQKAEAEAEEMEEVAVAEPAPEPVEPPVPMASVRDRTTTPDREPAPSVAPQARPPATDPGGAIGRDPGRPDARLSP